MPDQTPPAEMPSDGMDLDDRKALLQTFLAEAEERLIEMEETIVELESRPDDEELVQKLFRGAHTIKGNASCFAFSRVSEFAHALEDLLQRLRSRTLERDHSAAARATRASGLIGPRRCGSISASWTACSTSPGKSRSRRAACGRCWRRAAATPGKRFSKHTARRTGCSWNSRNSSSRFAWCPSAPSFVSISGAYYRPRISRRPPKCAPRPRPDRGSSRTLFPGVVHRAGHQADDRDGVRSLQDAHLRGSRDSPGPRKEGPARGTAHPAHARVGHSDVPRVLPPPAARRRDRAGPLSECCLHERDALFSRAQALRISAGRPDPDLDEPCRRRPDAEAAADLERRVRDGGGTVLAGDGRGGSASGVVRLGCRDSGDRSVHDRSRTRASGGLVHRKGRRDSPRVPQGVHVEGDGPPAGEDEGGTGDPVDGAGRPREPER